MYANQYPWYFLYDDTPHSLSAWDGSENFATEFALTPEGYLISVSGGYYYESQVEDGAIAYIQSSDDQRIFYDLPAIALAGHPLVCTITEALQCSVAVFGYDTFYSPDSFAFFGTQDGDGYFPDSTLVMGPVC